MYKKILVPVDGSEPSRKALQHAVALAERFGGEVVVFHVVQPVPVSEGFDFADELRETLTEQGRRLVTDYKEKYQTGTIAIKADTAFGIAVDVICDKAENEGFDLIVIGSRGLSTGARILLGSVSGRVSRRCHCPVMIVR